MGNVTVEDATTSITSSTTGAISQTRGTLTVSNSNTGSIAQLDGSFNISGSTIGSVTSLASSITNQNTNYNRILNSTVNGSVTSASNWVRLDNTTVTGGLTAGGLTTGTFGNNIGASAQLFMINGTVSGTFVEALGGGFIVLNGVSAQNLGVLQAIEDDAGMNIFSANIRTNSLRALGNAQINIQKNSNTTTGSTVSATEVIVGNAVNSTTYRPGFSIISFTDSTLNMVNGGQVLVGNIGTGGGLVDGLLDFVRSTYNGGNSTVKVGTGARVFGTGYLQMSSSNFTTTGETIVGDVGTGRFFGSSSSNINLGDLTIGNAGLGTVSLSSLTTLRAKNITIGKSVPSALATARGIMNVNNASVLLDSFGPANVLVGSSLGSVQGGLGEINLENGATLKGANSNVQANLYVGVNGLDGRVTASSNSRIEMHSTEIGQNGKLQLNSGAQMTTRFMNSNGGQVSLAGAQTRLGVGGFVTILKNNGTIVVSDQAIFDAGGFMNVGDGGIGSVSATTNSLAQGLGDIGVGNGSVGSVFADNSAVSLKSVGKNGGTGVVTISGRGQIFSSGFGSIGDQGTGTVNLRAGAIVSTSDISIGISGSEGVGFGRLNLDGANTYMNNATLLNGFTGFGSIRIGTGATLRSFTGITNSTYGTISGGGSIIGDVFNTGTISPGDSPGKLSIDGNFTQTNGMIDLEIGGVVSGQYDELFVTGTTNITGGKIRIRSVNGFDGSGLTSLQLFRGGMLNIASTVQIENATGWNVFFDVNSGQLQAVPEPASFAALGLGLIALRRRKKKA